MPVGPTNPSLGQPAPAVIPGPASPNTPYPVVQPAEFAPPNYPFGTETQTGVAAATINAVNQTVPGVPGPVGGFQLTSRPSTGAVRQDAVVLPPPAPPPGPPPPVTARGLYGLPSNGAYYPSFDATTISTGQVAATVAQMIDDLVGEGVLASGNVYSLTVTPGSFAFTTQNQNQLFTAVIKDAHGNVVLASPTWSTDIPGALTVNANTGIVTAITTGGTGHVTASFGGFSASVAVTTPATIASLLSISPSSIALTNATPATATATADDQWGKTVPATGTVWTTNNAAILTTSGNATASVSTITGSQAGTLTATLGGQSAGIPVTTAAAVLTTLAVDQPNVAFTAANQTAAVTATGYDQYGNPGL